MPKDAVFTDNIKFKLISQSFAIGELRLTLQKTSMGFWRVMLLRRTLSQFIGIYVTENVQQGLISVKGLIDITHNTNPHRGTVY